MRRASEVLWCLPRAGPHPRRRLPPKPWAVADAATQGGRPPARAGGHQPPRTAAPRSGTRAAAPRAADRRRGAAPPPATSAAAGATPAPDRHRPSLPSSNGRLGERQGRRRHVRGNAGDRPLDSGGTLKEAAGGAVHRAAVAARRPPATDPPRMGWQIFIVACSRPRTGGPARADAPRARPAGE
ncbi:hypothetical protein BU14_0048s0025 [Porphyra umbilicalis]|uniref:Uncharacterized protein n=1 Tax=Porphyra umbilicalis TaxID=2786 RepID=A0A1X6PIF2_PORUM|nr:hypothetical protein BU14_0048s0025 [Porphyra umbilicalis]|eukprot:OSX80610.1 hypothetical protein BU14_0048s0025 [Porphyra umbilicalis]